MKILLTLLLAFSLSSQAAPTALPLEACVSQAKYGFPVTKKKVVPICRKGYLSLFDEAAKLPVVVAYVLTPENAVGCFKREGFATDPVVKNVPTPKDYAKSGYDAGHLASAADLAWNRQTVEEAGFMTNITPQVPGFNRGVWLRLEAATRGWALSRNHPLQLYIVPIYDRAQDRAIGKNRVTVPTGYARVLVDTVTGEVLIFLLKNESSAEPLSSFLMSLAEVQRQSGVVLPLPPKPKFTGVWEIELKSAKKIRAGTCRSSG